ncbi:hypothetical protein KUTeg_000196 [Tegillarca granosa]|uniref:DDE Tnp4 domain-containing protein n=1 Tax=Tegillarca granosa TaxID=220873 RepID=A0ABQ9FWW5_TEGGR|nr:hypothetical protein KUTeg_000196 [Tegillarca granosa]
MADNKQVLKLKTIILMEMMEDDHVDNTDVVLMDSKNRQASLSVACALRRRNVPRVIKYLDTVHSYNNEEFRRRFRMDPQTFELLLNRFSVYQGKSRIPMEKQLLILIKYVSSQMTLQALADTFCVAESTELNIVKRLCDIICNTLLPEYIRWPDQRQMNQKKHQRISRSYWGNRWKPYSHKNTNADYCKSFPSVILQAICDADKHLIDVFCGWPGSVHDARVFKNSPLYSRIENDTDIMFPGNTCLVGDTGYGLQTWLMTPFRDIGNLTAAQHKYNHIHSCTRMPIEQCFGSLKGRFRRLKYVDMLCIERIIKVVLTCSTLHEFCLCNQDAADDFLEEGLESKKTEKFSPSLLDTGTEETFSDGWTASIHSIRGHGAIDIVVEIRVHATSWNTYVEGGNWSSFTGFLIHMFMQIAGAAMLKEKICHKIL